MIQQLETRHLKMTRRRVLGLFAATSVTGLAAALQIRPDAPVPEFLRWQGQALGANATLHFHHEDAAESRRLLKLALGEIDRLEGIFSLYRTESALARLNRHGVLHDPPAELVALLERAQLVSQVTNGAFDVTVQPLWSLYQRHFARNRADPDGPSQKEIASVQRLVGYQRLDISKRRISFERLGMAITLNGIAQGEITDRVADLLANEGLTHSLIDLGEMRAIGPHPSGRAWRVGLKDAFDTTRTTGKLGLTNRALATSAVTGTVFDRSGRHHHVLDPVTGAPGRGLVSASVVARRAATADALSTALLATEQHLAAPALARVGAEQIFTTDRNGGTRRLALV